MSKKTMLVIMDGWGLGKVKSADAIQNANVPFVSSLYSKYPNTTLIETVRSNTTAVVIANPPIRIKVINVRTVSVFMAKPR